ncbi:uncharacterized protein LOC120067123 [Benincasa hispida]|uniref:uncharacterized protein LOC120067123 n=1 Tax=Benincasa hispida TaxID=102211 RepID=UPI0019015120|nr:uncharacterized protein LOC120067123 [Benincasa hispida]
MGIEGHVLKRIPRIKFPERHPKSSASGSANQSQHNPSTDKDIGYYTLSGSNVPAPPQNMAVGGKASLLPKRTPVSDREIEAILLGGCF